MSNVTITWHGHSCFTVSADGYSIVLDPFAPGSVPGYPDIDLTANEVLCSHGHGDHNYTDGVKLVKSSAKSPFTVTSLDTFHDDKKGTQRGTDIIRILEPDGIRVAHLGDLGCMPEPEQIEALKGLDALMIPVGGFYTIDAAQARELVDLLKPRIVIPMHFSSSDFGYPVIGPLSEFTKYFGNVVVHHSATLEIDKDTEAQTAVLEIG